MYAINGKEESEQRKRLTPDVRNAIVHDLVTTMFAYVNKPNKEFCTKVAKKLVLKYSFMKDVGIGVSGYVSMYMLLETVCMVLHASHCIFYCVAWSRNACTHPAKMCVWLCTLTISGTSILNI